MRSFAPLASLSFIHGSFSRGVVALASGTAGAQLLAVLASPILTRLYKPEDFGVLAVFLAVLGVFSVLSCLRYELAIPLTKTASGALNTLVLSVLINLTFSIVLGVLILLLRQPLALILKEPRLAPYIWLLPIGVLCVGSYRALTFWAIREKQFKMVAQTKLTQAVSGIMTQTGIGFAASSPLGLILGQIIGQSAGILSLLRLVIKQSPLLRRAVRLNRIRHAALTHTKFPKFDLPAAGINTLAANLPQFLLAALFFPVVAGHYLLAWRVISMPVAIFGQAVGQSLYGHARQAAQEGTLYQFVCRLAGWLALLMLVPTILLFSFGPELFTWVFGTNWKIAGVYAGWMILGAAVQFIYSPLSLMLLATNSQHINLAIQLFMLFAKSGAILIGFVQNNPLSAIIALALADTLGYFFGFVLTLDRVRRYQKELSD